MSAWEQFETVDAFDAALSAVLFFSVVVLAMLACRQPARRILIARVALLASLAIIPLTTLRALPQLDLVNAVLSSGLVAHSTNTSSSIQPLHLPLDWVSQVAVRDHRLPDLLVHPGSGTWRWLAHVLVLMVLEGMGAGFAWLLLGFGGVQWLIRHSHPPSTATRDLYEPLVADSSRVARRSVLRVSTRVRRPVVVGSVRPMILIPEALDLPCGNPEFLRLSLLHELAHVERYDHWFNTVANLAQTVWFFLPHTWWLRSHLMIDQEFLADQSAASRYGTSSAYASSLLSMAAHHSVQDVGEFDSPSTGEPSKKKIGVPSALFQRMVMLLHCPFPIEARAPRSGPGSRGSPWSECLWSRPPWSFAGRTPSRPRRGRKPRRRRDCTGFESLTSWPSPWQARRMAGPSPMSCPCHSPPCSISMSKFVRPRATWLGFALPVTS